MELSNDALLPLSRRLDWRFLFPNPTLKQVAHAGARGDLLQALTQFSQSVTDDLSTEYDLVVLVNPSWGKFVQAVGRTNAFYVEFYRPKWPQRIMQWTVPDRFLKSARQQGFQAQAYWHYPTFSTANRILPLSETSPLLNVLAKDRTDTKTRLKQQGMALFLKSGLLARSVSCISIVGYRA